MWNFYTQGTLIATIITVFLVIVVLKNNPRRALNQTYFIPSFFFLFWNAVILLDNIFLTQIDLQALSRAAVLFLPASSFHFLLVFLRNHSRNDWLLLKIFYGVSAVTFLLIIQLSTELKWPRFIIAIYLVVVVLKSTQNLYQHFNRSVSLVERYQIIYLAIGILVWITGGVVDFLKLPAHTVYPVSSLGGLTFLSIAAWSSIRLRLADISVLTGKIVVYVSMILFFSLLYFLFSQSWPDTPFSQILKVVFAVLLFLLVYEPITRWVEEWSEKILLRQSYQLISMLKDLNRSLVTMIESSQVFRKFLQTLSRAEKIANASLFLREGKEGDYYPFHSAFFPIGRLTKIEKDKPIISYLDDTQEIIVRDEIERELQMIHLASRKKQILAVYRTMTVLDADICVPILFQSQVRGFFVLKSNETTMNFSRREKELFLQMADQMGIITENARLYTLMKKQDRLAALGQMSTGLAHEIRNPLGALKAVAQHLETTQTDNELKEYLQIIVEEVNRLNDVVVRFLSFAHPLKLNVNETNLNDLIIKTVNLLKNEETCDGILFQLELQDDLPTLPLDENQIKQVLMNLIRNSQQALDNGGTITITTELKKGSQQPLRKKKREKKRDQNIPEDASHQQQIVLTQAIVELSIEDNGCGIPPDLLDKIFTPFFTTKESGSGLGLSIAHQIVEAHGAEIEANSHPDYGTKFIIRFQNLSSPVAQEIKS